MARKGHQFLGAEVTCGFESSNLGTEFRSSERAATALTAEPFLEPLYIGLVKDSLSSKLQFKISQWEPVESRL